VQFINGRVEKDNLEPVKTEFTVGGTILSKCEIKQGLVVGVRVNGRFMGCCEATISLSSFC